VLAEIEPKCVQPILTTNLEVERTVRAPVTQIVEFRLTPHDTNDPVA